MIKTVRKKPVEVRAIEYTGDPDDARNFVGDAFEVTHTQTGIQTLEGFMRVNPGDWIIRGVRGEFYPCRPDIFAATYDVVSEGE